MIAVKEVNQYTAEDIRAMNYNELIGLTRETNRTPGGLATIKYVAKALHIGKDTKVLDIGTSTGHTALELSRLTGCSVTGIDINPMSLGIARERAEAMSLSKLEFVETDATKMTFGDNIFDVVFAGNVTSLIDDKNKALDEYLRVLKPLGYIVAIPMYYLKKPEKQLLDAVGKAIRVDIRDYYKDDWVKFFLRDRLEIFDAKDFRFITCSEEQIDKFCRDITEREHLSGMKPDARRELVKKYSEYMHLFNANQSIMGFSVLILRNKESEKYNDPQLFYGEEV